MERVEGANAKRPRSFVNIKSLNTTRKLLCGANIFIDFTTDKFNSAHYQAHSHEPSSSSLLMLLLNKWDGFFFRGFE